MRSNPMKVGLGLAASLVLAGCETPQQTATAQCAIGGGVLTYALCKATKNSDSYCAALSAAVAAAAAVACYDYAGRLERRRKELEGRENDLNARLAYVRGLNEDSKGLNERLTQQLASTTQKTDQVVARIRSAQISADEIRRERQELDKNAQAASLQVAKGEESLVELKKYRAQLKTAPPDLDAEVVKYEQLVASARQKVAQMNAQSARVTA